MAAVIIATSNISSVSSATQLPSLACVEVVVQAHRSISASVNVFVGNASGQFMSLSAGDTINWPVSEMSQTYVTTTGGSATIVWAAVQGHPYP